MSDAGGDINRSYRSMLARYVDVGHEDQLEAAYALGRQAFADGMTLLELLALHRSAVEALVGGEGEAADPYRGWVEDERSTHSDRDRVMASFRFLAEALGTFEMAQRGYREAQERARLEHERATREHAVALMLQEDLLPTHVPNLPRFELAVRYQPGEIGSHAGGDWYDIVELSDDRASFVVGDVTGHGVGAAASMGQMRIAVLAYALAGFEPADVVSGVDSLMARLGGDDLATLVLVTADPAWQQLLVANAGHPPPLVVSPGGDVRLISEGHDRLVGIQPPLQQRRAATVGFTPGSLLLLYTDGLIEHAERRGHDGVRQLAATASGFNGTAEDLCDLVLGKMAPHAAEDDICIVAAQLLPAPD